jgi:hypothetical protein
MMKEGVNNICQYARRVLEDVRKDLSQKEWARERILAEMYVKDKGEWACLIPNESALMGVHLLSVPSLLTGNIIYRRRSQHRGGRNPV